jgi:hypothetical protein
MWPEYVVDYLPSPLEIFFVFKNFISVLSSLKDGIKPVTRFLD